MAEERDINYTFVENYDNNKNVDSEENNEESEVRKHKDNVEGQNEGSQLHEYSIREENIRLKSRLEQAKERALVLEKDVIKYKDDLLKEKEISEKATETIEDLMNEKQTSHEDLKRHHTTNGHHKGVEEVVRKLENEIYLLEERLERQRKRHHHEHLLMYEELKEERRKQEEWKQTYLRSQVSVMAFRRKLELMSDRMQKEDRAELMKCLEVGLNNCQDDVKDKHMEASGKRKERLRINRNKKSTKHKSATNNCFITMFEEESSCYGDVSSSYCTIIDGAIDTIHREKESSPLPTSNLKANNTSSISDHHRIKHDRDEQSREFHLSSNDGKYKDRENEQRLEYETRSSVSQRKSSPKPHRQSPNIEESNPPKVYIMDEENKIHTPKPYSNNNYNIDKINNNTEKHSPRPTNQQTNHKQYYSHTTSYDNHMLKQQHSPTESHRRHQSPSRSNHLEHSPLGHHSSIHQYKLPSHYDLDSNKHISHNSSLSPRQNQLHQSRDVIGHPHASSGNSHHMSSGHSRGTNERNTHYKHWHHFSADNPAHSRGTNGGSSNNSSGRGSDLHHGGNETHNGHASYKYHNTREEPSKYNRYGKSYGDYSDKLELNVNDTKFLELKFNHHDFLKGETRNHTIQSAKMTPNNDSFISMKTQVVPIGTPLEHKKIWCLICDGEVTKKPCGHSGLVIQEREKEFPCPTCNRIFNNRSHLKRHNMIHSGEKPWACTFCEKRFNRKSHLNRHLLTHTGERPFKCPYCTKGFADNSDLKRHKQIHESTPGFIPIRPKESVPASAHSSLTSQNMHMASSTTVHVTPSLDSSFVKTGDNTFVKRKADSRFQCSKCGKVFTRKSHLTRHKLTHDQVKIYCDCGRMFRQKSHLQAHLPACKRKRDAIEAKYIAEHGPQPEQHIKKEETASSALNTEIINHGSIDEQDRQNNNNSGEYHNGTKPVMSENALYNTKDGVRVKHDDDLTLSFTPKLPSGIPPLIRDPA